MATTLRDAPKAASAGIFRYAPDTRLDWTITVPVAYDLSTVTAVFEVRKLDAVIFRYSTGVDSNISITDQVITVAMTPAADSEDSLGYTFAEAMTSGATDFNLDLGQTGSAVVDYRIQGEFKILTTHGNFC